MASKKNKSNSVETCNNKLENQLQLPFNKNQTQQIFSTQTKVISINTITIKKKQDFIEQVIQNTKSF